MIRWQEYLIVKGENPDQEGTNVGEHGKSTTQKASVICAYLSNPAGELVKAKVKVPASAVQPEPTPNYPPANGESAA